MKDDADLPMTPAPDEPMIDDEGRINQTDLWHDFGEWLGRLRLAKGLTKRQAAANAGVSASTWSTLEAGGRRTRGVWYVPSPEDVTLVRVAQAIGEDPYELFERVQRPWDDSLSPAGEPRTPPSTEVRFTALEHEVRGIRSVLDELKQMVQELHEARLAPPRKPR